MTLARLERLFRPSKEHEAIMLRYRFDIWSTGKLQTAIKASRKKFRQ